MCRVAIDRDSVLPAGVRSRVGGTHRWADRPVAEERRWWANPLLWALLCVVVVLFAFAPFHVRVSTSASEQVLASGR